MKKIALLSLLFWLLPCQNSWGLIDLCTINGDPSPLTVSTATAGSEPDSVTATTTYSITASLASTRIIGELSQALPQGVTLEVELEAPIGATSQGMVALSPTPVDLVTGVPLVSLLVTLDVTFRLSATVQASPTAGETAEVTLTIL